VYIDKIMTDQVIAINEQTHLNEMVELMQQHKLEHLPVVHSNGELIGIVSHFDIQKATPSTMTTLSIGEINYLLAKITAQQIMQKDVIYCHPDTLIEEAGQIMRRHTISSLPIIDNKKLVGIVTMEDILDFFLDITGCHQKDATRIAVRVSDTKGSLSHLLDSINELNCYIATVVSPTELDAEGRRICIVRYYSDRPHEVDQQLKQQGFEIMSENFLAEQPELKKTEAVGHRTIAQQDIEQAQDIANWIIRHDHLAKNMIIEIEQVEKGSCVLSMKVTSALMNAAGVVHGGAVFTMADIACAIAANSHNKTSLTINGNINFLTSAKKGDTLLARTKEVALGNTMANYQVEIMRQSDNTLIALFNGAVFRKKSSVISSDNQANKQCATY